MRLKQRYSGVDDLFQGERTLWLRNLPVDARVTKATITLMPSVDSGFRVKFGFTEPAAPGELLAKPWGITKTEPLNPNFIEVDFHARRTLVGLTGSGGDCVLQVDMGGAYVGISDDGTLLAPDKNPLRIPLSSDDSPLPGLTVNKFRLARPTNSKGSLGSMVRTLSGSLSGLIGTVQGIIANWQGSTAMTEETANSIPPALNVATVTIQSFPTNVNVRLEPMPPFWQLPGELAKLETSQDFAGALNTFLEKAEVENGFYQIPLRLHSDTLARLDIDLALEFVIERQVLPTCIPKLTLTYGLGAEPVGDGPLLTSLMLSLKALPVKGQTQARIRGDFQSTRIAMGTISEEPSAFPVPISL